MAAGFTPLDLRTELCQHSAVPLILPSDLEWNRDTGSVVRRASSRPSTDLELLPVQDALDLLATVDKRVAVLAICGPYRSGKSFFLSRVVGQPGAFRLGHSMEPCTRGIWLSTTALDCGDFLLLLLDTEGIGAVEGEGPESFTTKLLVATIFLSSFLIYNSMEVPRQADLQQMSSFAHLSTAIKVSENKENDPKDFQRYFPHFMWLLRDVTNPPYDDNEDDEMAALSRFLKEEVLTQTGQRDCDAVITAITTLFPQPILCNYLPYPNEDPQGSDLNNEENIDEDFSEQFCNVINGIRASLRPKVKFGGQEVAGSDLADLTMTCIESINNKGSVPSLEGSWKAVVRLKLTKEADALVATYEEEMSLELAGEEPLDVTPPEADAQSSKPTLMALHKSIFKRKRRALVDKACQMLPGSGESSQASTTPQLDKDSNAVLQKFDSDIVVMNDEGVVKAGVFHKFVTQNYAKSEKHCMDLWKRLEEESGIERNCTRALNKYDPQICLEVLSQLMTLKESYNESAVGPAREAVFTSKVRRWDDTEVSLRAIPGPPTNLDVVGKSSSAMKLQWDLPSINPAAATTYIVEYRKGERGEWIVAIRTPNQWYIMKDLKCNTLYQFRVSSWNDQAEEAKKSIEEMLRKAREEGKMGTRLGKLERAILSTIGFLGGTAVAPLLAAVGLPALTIESRKAAEAAAACVSIPFFATLGAPIVGGTVAYEVMKATGATGDLKDCYVPRDLSTADAQSLCSSTSNASE